MGSISNDNQEFAVINIALEDLFKADDNAIRFVLASLGVHFLRRAAPDVAKQINQSFTMTNWFFDKGEFVVCVGKKDFDEAQIKGAIEKYKAERIHG